MRRVAMDVEQLFELASTGFRAVHRSGYWRETVGAQT
jgi:hypothetical protein